MLLRRFGPLSLAILATACAPPVDKVPGPSQVDYAVFDVTSAVPSIPQPNDLVLLGDISALPVPEAQRDLLRDFQSAGDPANRGFPNDQEVAISIDFQTVQVGEGGLRLVLAEVELVLCVPERGSLPAQVADERARCGPAESLLLRHGLAPIESGVLSEWCILPLHIRQPRLKIRREIRHGEQNGRESEKCGTRKC